MERAQMQVQSRWQHFTFHDFVNFYRNGGYPDSEYVSTTSWPLSLLYLASFIPSVVLLKMIIWIIKKKFPSNVEVPDEPRTKHQATYDTGRRRKTYTRISAHRNIMLSIWHIFSIKNITAERYQKQYQTFIPTVSQTFKNSVSSKVAATDLFLFS